MNAKRTSSPDDPLHPAVRLLCGGLLVIACLAVSSGTWGSWPAYALLTTAGILLGRPAPARFLKVLAAGVLMYAPLFLFMAPGPALKGSVTAVVALVTVSSLTARQLHDAILGLPLPALPRLLLQQILHQMEVLRAESRRIHQAVSVRGGIQGAAATWLFVRSFPQVWLPRVVFKADRVAMAMDLRGYGDHVPSTDPVRWGQRELLTLALCAAGALTLVLVSFLVSA